MPAVRAHMVLAALGQHGDMLGSAPTPDGVEQFDGDLIEGWVACEHEQEVVSATVAGISDVIGVEVDELCSTPTADAARAARPAEEAVAAAPSAEAAVPETAEVAHDAGRDDPEPAVAAAPPATPGRPPSRARARPPDPRPWFAHGARRRRAAGCAHALDGRARHPPHRTGGDCLAAGRARAAPGDAGAHPQLAGTAGDGHAGPHDPCRRRLPALPAACARSVHQARQGGPSRADRFRNRTGPHGRRRARRPSRPPGSQLARPRPRAR